VLVHLDRHRQAHTASELPSATGSSAPTNTQSCTPSMSLEPFDLTLNSSSHTLTRWLCQTHIRQPLSLGLNRCPTASTSIACGVRQSVTAAYAIVAADESDGSSCDPASGAAISLHSTLYVAGVFMTPSLQAVVECRVTAADFWLSHWRTRLFRSLCARRDGRCGMTRWSLVPTEICDQLVYAGPSMQQVN